MDFKPTQTSKNSSKVDPKIQDIMTSPVNDTIVVSQTITNESSDTRNSENGSQLLLHSKNRN